MPQGHFLRLVGGESRESGRVSSASSLLTDSKTPPPPNPQASVAPSGEILILSLFLGRVPVTGAERSGRRCEAERLGQGEAGGGDSTNFVVQLWGPL